MKTIEKNALALISLGTGGFYLKDGRLCHDDCGELPSVKEIAAVVEAHPEEIADILLDDAISESLPVELDTPTVRRITAGAGTVADVERLTMARAEASRIVFSIGQALMDEAGEASSADAAEIIVAFARGGCALQEDGGFKLLGGECILPEHQTVTAALDREPGKVAALLRSHCESIGIVPKRSDVFSLSTQLAGFHHSALSLGLDELRTAMKPKRSAPWENGRDEPLMALSNQTSELAAELVYFLSRDLHVRNGLLLEERAIIDRINTGRSTKGDIRALLEEMKRVIASA